MILEDLFDEVPEPGTIEHRDFLKREIKLYYLQTKSEPTNRQVLHIYLGLMNQYRELYTEFYGGEEQIREGA